MLSGLAHWQEFEVAVHTGSLQCQRDVLEQCKQTSGLSAESMLKLAALSKRASHSTPDIAREALHAALKLLLSKGHAVQYDQVAQVLHAVSDTAGIKISVHCMIWDMCKVPESREIASEKLKHTSAQVDRLAVAVLEQHVLLMRL